ncbi:MAG: hypothetical protein P4L83_13160 [Nevskia sp.]|nr:hypothetical protein [Nevskia sp.]
MTERPESQTDLGRSVVRTLRRAVGTEDLAPSLHQQLQVGAEKGYVFVGMDATLLSAFFVRRDVWVETLPERRPVDYLRRRMNPLLHI